MSEGGATPRDPRELLTRAELALAGRGEARYPTDPPFHPDTIYPEYPFDARAPEHGPLATRNGAYAAVRESLRLLGLDAKRFGTREWNPLGELIAPGERVLLKPNAVLDRHALGLDPYAIITHPSVLRALVDYCVVAQAGTITIADAPQFNADFERYLEVTRLDSIVTLHRSLGREVELLDLRRLSAATEDGVVRATSRRSRSGDPLGYATIDLGAQSVFATLPNCDRIYGADYDRAVASSAHLGGKHLYCVARSVLAADLFISVPKLKTHGKVGVTLNLKGLVGINGDKNYVPHYRIGPVESGGDEYPSGLAKMERGSRAAQRFLIDRLLSRGDARGEAIYRRLTRAKQAVGAVLRQGGVLPKRPSLASSLSAGEWYGNDTAWRMTADLARILLYSDRDGAMRDAPQRRFLSVVDGIVAGEGDGPLEPRPRDCGLVLAGFNPALVDEAAAAVMGIDRALLPQLRVHDEKRWILRAPLEAARVASEGEARTLTLRDLAARSLQFELPIGWKGARRAS